MMTEFLPLFFSRAAAMTKPQAQVLFLPLPPSSPSLYKRYTVALVCVCFANQVTAPAQFHNATYSAEQLLYFVFPLPSPIANNKVLQCYSKLN